MLTSVKSAQKLYEDAHACIARQDFDGALRCLEDSLAMEETPEALHDKGVILYMTGNPDDAVACLREAIRLNPRYDQAYANLAGFMFNAGHIAQALEYTALAMKTAPANLDYQDNFIALLENVEPDLFNADLKELITRCLETEGLPHDRLARPWLALLRIDPAFKDVFTVPETDWADGIRACREALRSPYFIMGLRRILIPDRTFERFLTRLRRFLLEEGGEEDLALTAALAEYCFQTDYIFPVGADERPHGGDASPLRIALTACYVPLFTLETAQDIATSAPSALKALVARQIMEPLAERALRETIPVLTPVEDPVSKTVREQYEDFPYPRWKNINPHYAASFSPGEPIEKILVAGCGTGKEALEFARAFPQADILAVDISLASLSYGLRKAGEMSIENVSFRQADILNMEDFGTRFDLISAAGVLHHMQNPQAGCAVLAGLLRPGGYMHIALYSTLARRHIATARAVIAGKGYGNAPEDIRRFREEAPNILSPETLRGLEIFRDYYSVPECRDLLFHAVEHTFSLPDVAALLESANLNVLGLTLDPSLQAAYAERFPDDPEMTHLHNWGAFEETHPDTFAAMIDFWCRKA